MRSLFEKVVGDLREGARGARLLRSLLQTVDGLVTEKRERFGRVLPLADYFVDRWDKARALGFGEGTNVYDSCLVLGDVTMGKDCWVGPFTILDGSGGLTIGDRCTVSAGVHVYSHDNIAQTLDGASIERSPVTIGSHVYIGPHSVIARGVTIGDRVVIGAHSLVVADVPSGTKVAGCPARVIGKT